MLQARWSSLVRLGCVLIALAAVACRAALFVFSVQYEGFLLSFDGGYLDFIIAAEIIVLALSFTNTARKASKLALVIPVAAMAYWWFIVDRGRSPIWGDFMFLVIPETCFAVAIFARTRLTRQYRVDVQMSE